jgi:hypothetical protein
VFFGYLGRPRELIFSCVRADSRVFFVCGKVMTYMCYPELRQVKACKHEVLQGVCSCTLALSGVGDANLGKEAFHCSRGCRTASRVWLAFDRVTNLCTLPHKDDHTRVCGKLPKQGTGTSGHRQHLDAEHPGEWLHIKQTGQVKTSVQMIKDAFAASVDESKPALGKKETNELNCLVALWVSKCGRSQAIVEDAELRTLLARILDMCKAKLRYELAVQ